MTQEVFYDKDNKSFAIVDKKYNKISKVLKIINEVQFDDQLKLIQSFQESVDFVNDLKNNVLPDYMLNLKIARRWRMI